MVGGFFLDYIESSTCWALVVLTVHLVSEGTFSVTGYSSKGNCTRIIAVGQHWSSAPRNPFLSQRLKCEATGRSATAPELDDKGSSRGAAHRSKHYNIVRFRMVSVPAAGTGNLYWIFYTTWRHTVAIETGDLQMHNCVKNLVWYSFYSAFWSPWAHVSFAPTFRTCS
jgi:hypothetical protein